MFNPQAKAKLLKFLTNETFSIVGDDNAGNRKRGKHSISEGLYSGFPYRDQPKEFRGVHAHQQHGISCFTSEGFAQTTNKKLLIEALGNF
jgi:hypothetical protein